MAHEHRATVRWTRDGAPFTDNRYGRGHVWIFDGGVTVPASSSPAVVPLPYSRADAVDPEEAFVASLSSCHMLFFLSLAARRGFVVDAYEDAALGVMAKNGEGRLFVARVTLDPAITWAGERRPTSDEVARLHHDAHDACFIAHSVRTEVVVAGLPAHA